jgi:hypothetical protein
MAKIKREIEGLSGKVVFGFDGIIDSVWNVLESRADKDNFEIIREMKRFGGLITGRGEGGLTNEIIQKRRVCGGFTSNTGRVPARLGLKPTMVGTYGAAIDPAFSEFAGKAEMISVGEPSFCHVFEFDDGKVMLPFIQGLLNLTWSDIERSAGAAAIRDALTGADVVAVGYWALMPDFDGILQRLNDGCFSESRPKRLFFDFADITMRTEAAFKGTVDRLAKMPNCGNRVLSLNEHEAAVLFSYYGKQFDANAENAAGDVDEVRRAIGFDELIVHTPRCAYAANDTETATVPQVYRERPVRTAGAGDSFNGGYISACLGDLSLRERLTMANAATYDFVSNGLPPTRGELVKTIEEYFCR